MVNFSALTPYSRPAEASPHRLGLEWQGALRGGGQAALDASAWYYRRANKTYDNPNTHIYEYHSESRLKHSDGLLNDTKLRNATAKADVRKLIKKPYTLLMHKNEEILTRVNKDMRFKLKDLKSRLPIINQFQGVHPEKSWITSEMTMYKDYNSRISNKWIGTKFFRGAAGLKLLNAALTFDQIYRGLTADNKNADEFRFANNSWRVFGEVMGGEVSALLAGRFLSAPGALAGGYLGTVYGGRVADAIYR